MGKKFKDIKHELNPAFDQLLEDHEHGELHSVCDYSVIRPAYAYTSQCFKEKWKEGIVPGSYKARLREDDHERSDLNSDTWNLILDKS